jgi:LacI family transcriptional regulator
LLLLPNVADGYLDVIEKRRFPCVFVSFDAKEMNLPIVGVENRIGARSAVEHLLSLGHRRIGFIAGSGGSGQSAERQKGYVDALLAAGLEIDPMLIAEGGFIQTGGYSSTEQLLSIENPPTAIFAANDEMAFGAIDAIHSKGMNVPEDLSVIGFDDIPTASHVFPPLTTMRQPLVDIATKAVGELVELIQGREIGASKVTFPMELVIRKSTGPAPQAGGDAPS